MGLHQSKYWVPFRVDSEQDIADFYTRNRDVLLRTTLRAQAAPDTPEICEFVTKAAASGKFPHFVEDSDNFAEYMRNCTEGMEEYRTGVRGSEIAARFAGAEVQRRVYDEFYNSPAAQINHEYTMTHPRKDAVAPLIPTHTVQKFLDQVLDTTPRAASSEPFAYIFEPQTPPLNNALSRTLQDSIDIVERTWDVSIHGKFSLYGWWYDYHRLQITAPGLKPGTAWVAKHYQGPSLAIPVGVRDTVVLAGNDAKMIHELTHAVQFTCAPFWTWPREIAEVPTMAIERQYNGEFPDWLVRRQTAMAYADLTCADGADFNKIFAEKGGYTGVGLVSAKMWHYVAMPHTYYSYALGMRFPLTHMTKHMVRSPEKLRAVVEDAMRDAPKS